MWKASTNSILVNPTPESIFSQVEASDLVMLLMIIKSGLIRGGVEGEIIARIDLFACLSGICAIILASEF